MSELDIDSTDRIWLLLNTKIRENISLCKYLLDKNTVGIQKPNTRDFKREFSCYFNFIS